MMNLHRRAVLWSAAAAVSLALASADAAPNCSLAPGPELARFYRAGGRAVVLRKNSKASSSFAMSWLRDTLGGTVLDDPPSIPALRG